MQSSDIYYRKVNPTSGDVSRVTAPDQIFPNVTPDEATAGLDRVKALYFAVESADNDILSDVRFFLRHPSTGGYRVLLGLGESFDENSTPQIAAGILDSETAIGATSFDVQMAGDESLFVPGGYLMIHDQLSTGQTVDSAAKPGDSVSFSVDAWSLVSPTSDYTYPAGIFIGAGVVFTAQPTSNIEFLKLPENLNSDESIGTGDGNATVELSTLSAPGNGVFSKTGFFPVVSTLVSGVARAATIDENGYASGYCSAGQLNLETGVWITDITWIAPPDMDADITITYQTNPFSKVGSLYTVETEDTAAAVFAAGSIVSGVLTADIQAAVDDIDITSTAGTLSGATVTNHGALNDIYDIAFQTETTIQATARSSGAVVGTGPITSDFSGIDPETGRTLFTLPAASFGGTFAPADTITLTTSAAAERLNYRQIVDAGASAGYEFFIDGYYA